MSPCRLALVLVAACSHLHRTPSRARHVPSPADAALAAVDDRAAFAHLDARLDRNTGSIAHGGNHVELLVDGKTSFDHRIANARDADLILVKTFAFTDDETGRAVADVLVARARAGAHVVVQYDAIGSIHDPGDVAPMISNGNEKPIISSLRAAGIRVVASNAPVGAFDLNRDLPFDIAGFVGRTLRHPADHAFTILARTRQLEFHDHEKYWITGKRRPDGTLALTVITGGMNIGSEYGFGGVARPDAITGARGWHDVDVEVTGPVVNDIVARYFDVLEAQAGTPRDDTARATWNRPQPIVGNARVRFVYNHPRFGNHHAIEEVYAALIDATPAHGVVRIESAYFAPSTMLRGSLERALRRGTRLAVISNLETNDTAPVAEGTWFVYHALLEASPSAALFQRIARPDLGGVMIHCKVASFGTRGPVIVGSANLDAQSGEHNSEGVLVIEDDVVRAQFDAMYAVDYAPDRAARITLESLEQSSTWQDLRRWAIWNVGWTLL